MKTLVGPALFAVSLVLDSYAKTAGHWTETLRPMAILILGACVMTAVAWLLLRRPVLASFIGLLSTCAILRPQLALLILGIGLTVLALMQWRRIRRVPKLNLSMSAITVPTVLLCMVAIFGLVQRGVLAPADFDFDFDFDEAADAVAGREAELPSMYVLLLDGYPRADSLLSRFGIDNAAFAHALGELGLGVYPNATSAFQGTELSLASSMLADSEELRHLTVGREGQRLLTLWRETRRQYLTNVPTMDRMRESGYRLIQVASQVSHTQWTGWDVQIDSGQVTDLETALIQRSALGSILDRWVMDQHRARLEDTLAAWSATARDPQQKVAFAHLMAPHPPFLYGPDAAKVVPLACWYEHQCSLFTVHVEDLNLSTADYGRRLAAHIESVNQQVLESVRQVIVADPDAIVVVFSDHGGRFSKQPDAEWNRTLLASRIPHDPDALATDPGPDALFVRLLESVSR